MTVLTYIAGGILCIGWVVLIAISLSSKSEYDKLNELFVSPPTKDHHRNSSENGTG